MEELDIDVFFKEIDNFIVPTAFSKIQDINDILGNMTYDERSKRLKQLYSISEEGKTKLYKKILYSGDYCASAIAILASVFLSQEQINNLVDNMKMSSRRAFTDLIIAAGRAHEFINRESRFRYNFFDSDMKDLIIATGNPEAYLNKNLTQGIIFDKNIIFEIICSLENMEDYLDYRKLNELGVEYLDIIDFAYQYDNYSFMEIVIKNSDRLHIDPETIYELKNIVSTSKRIEEMKNRTQEERNKHLVQCNSELTIPEKMKVGVEIESFGTLYWKYAKEYFKDKYNWKAKDDLSIDPDEQTQIDIEITSPILTGDCRKSEEQIIGVCSDLVEVGQKTNGSCGGHIHIDSSYLSNVHAYQNLLDLWSNAEKVLYIISNKAGTINREDTAKYAKPISKKLVHQIENGMINLSDDKTIEELKLQLVDFQEQAEEDLEYMRYAGINFSNINGSGTIEFRLPNGSIDPNVWIQNINLFGGLVKVSQDLSLLQDKSIDELAPEEYHKLELFEALKTEPLSEEEKLHILLELVIPEKDRFIYEERFRKNRSLLRIYDGIDDSISEWITNKKVNISPNVIGKRCFTGGNCLTMQELSVVDSFVRREISDKHMESKMKGD